MHQLSRRRFSTRQVIGIFGFALMLIGALITVFLTSINQDIRQQASDDSYLVNPSISPVVSSGSSPGNAEFAWNYTTNQAATATDWANMKMEIAGTYVQCQGDVCKRYVLNLEDTRKALVAYAASNLKQNATCSQELDGFCVAWKENDPPPPPVAPEEIPKGGVKFNSSSECVASCDGDCGGSGGKYCVPENIISQADYNDCLATSTVSECRFLMEHIGQLEPTAPPKPVVVVPSPSTPPTTTLSTETTPVPSPPSRYSPLVPSVTATPTNTNETTDSMGWLDAIRQTAVAQQAGEAIANGLVNTWLWFEDVGYMQEGQTQSYLSAVTNTNPNSGYQIGNNFDLFGNYVQDCQGSDLECLGGAAKLGGAGVAAGGAAAGGVAAIGGVSAIPAAVNSASTAAYVYGSSYVVQPVVGAVTAAVSAAPAVIQPYVIPGVVLAAEYVGFNQGMNACSADPGSFACAATITGIQMGFMDDAASSVDDLMTQFSDDIGRVSTSASSYFDELGAIFAAGQNSVGLVDDAVSLVDDAVSLTDDAVALADDAAELTLEEAQELVLRNSSDLSDDEVELFLRAQEEYGDDVFALADDLNVPGGGSVADDLNVPGGGSVADDLDVPGGGSVADDLDVPGGSSVADDLNVPGGSSALDELNNPPNSVSQLPDPNDGMTLEEAKEVAKKFLEMDAANPDPVLQDSYQYAKNTFGDEIYEPAVAVPAVAVPAEMTLEEARKIITDYQKSPNGEILPYLEAVEKFGLQIYRDGNEELLAFIQKNRVDSANNPASYLADRIKLTSSRAGEVISTADARLNELVAELTQPKIFGGKVDLFDISDRLYKRNKPIYAKSDPWDSGLDDVVDILSVSQPVPNLNSIGSNNYELGGEGFSLLGDYFSPTCPANICRHNADLVNIAAVSNGVEDVYNLSWFAKTPDGEFAGHKIVIQFIPENQDFIVADPTWGVTFNSLEKYQRYIEKSGYSGFEWQIEQIAAPIGK